MEVYGIDKVNFSTWFKNRRLAPKAKKGKIPSAVTTEASAGTETSITQLGSDDCQPQQQQQDPERSSDEATGGAGAAGGAGDSLRSEVRFWATLLAVQASHEIHNVHKFLSIDISSTMTR